ncbi:MAG: hypothetical protein IKT08_09570 [Bacteroidales bacterium]|nr:hypothetical protein [Bacteroidales bacterium]
MRKTVIHIALLTCCLLTTIVVQAQTFRDDFENQYTWYPPWSQIQLAVDSSHVATDSTLMEYNTYCLCDTTMEFGLDFNFPIADSLWGRNLHLNFQADYRFPDTLGQGELVFIIHKNGKDCFWQSHPLDDFSNDSAAWFHVHIDLDIPADYVGGGTLHFFLWNSHKNNIHTDNASLQLTSWTLPSFLPDIQMPDDDSLDTGNFQLHAIDSLPLTHPIGMVVEYILDQDTISEFNLFAKQDENHYFAVSSIDTTEAWLYTRNNDSHHVLIPTATHFYKDCRLLRQALVIPFIDSTLTVFRRNQAIDSTLFQSEYYLDREGFKIGEGERSVIVYYETEISSMQLDAKHHTAYFNLDYWRDHPLIHYPLNDDVEDRFVDVSSRPIHKGMSWMHHVNLSLGYDLRDMPRIMPLPEGYESGIIFTEHADWTDLRTHRATYFGNEHVTKARKATGGFVYYGIPVTKSIFYNNPDRITNAEASHGIFPGLQATIKTDKDFEKFLRQLNKQGYEICLHTPEQYSTTPSNLAEAMRYMERNFKSVSWIDHGYNNGAIHNREDLVCDALDQNSDQYADQLWRKHGVKYLWNAYYEENRMEQWCFDNNLMQPYPGFGDALPNRQITPITGNPSFLTWSTPSTLDANNDSEWDYYFHPNRLDQIVKNHTVFITHTYPAWTDPQRAFWTYDEDSTIIALPGMNRALERIAQLREERKMLPMTVKTYLDYYCCLRDVIYEVVDDRHISITNLGKEIKGFTILCTKPILFDDYRFYEFKKSGNDYFVWFNLKAMDKVIIEIKN